MPTAAEATLSSHGYERSAVRVVDVDDTVAMLGYEGKHTMVNTLESYKRSGLLDLADDKLIFWQRISKPYPDGTNKRGV